MFEDGGGLCIRVSKSGLCGVSGAERVVNGGELIPSRRSQAVEADLVYTSDVFSLNRRRSRVSYFRSAGDDGKERI
jgi:hypothetical protein